MSFLWHSASATWGIAALATSGVIIRPWRLPEAVWAVLGAAALVAFGLLSWSDAVSGILKGLDVYLFLIGMMLLAELARREGLFNWLAALAVRFAKGSPKRLFTLIYMVGIVVTVFLSNDATAVVLTPAVYAAARAAGAEPLPYLFVCAFIANAASFVLPISNPANLVIYAEQMPALPEWLGQFGLASVVAILVTYVALRWTLRQAIASDKLASCIHMPVLSHGGRIAGASIGITAVALLACSGFGFRLGVATFICGTSATLVIIAITRTSPWPVLRDISWGVIPLVAGLFVLVEALVHTGVIESLNEALKDIVAAGPTGAGWITTLFLAIACNLMNNLPVGLIAGSVIAADHLPQHIAAAAVIAVDLGPNLSVTGSLATILWLAVLRREGESVSAWRFLQLGALVMLPTLLLTTLVLTFA